MSMFRWLLIFICLFGSFFSTAVMSEMQVSEYEQYHEIKLEYEAHKRQQTDEIQAIFDQYADQKIPIAEATYRYTNPYRQEVFEYPLIFEVVMFGTPEQLGALIAAGADVNALFPGGHLKTPSRTPIYFANNAHHPYATNAWFECRPEQARQLLAAGAEIEQPSFNSYSLLGQYTAPAMIKGCTETLAMLIQAGADVNAQDVLGRTALSDALLVNDMQGVEVLLAAGADPNLQDITGLSVFEHALQMSLGYLPIEDSEDSQPNTLRRFIELAVEKKYEENIEILRQQRDEQSN
ncbi:ankyrin repeat domain-containing protein [Nitrincola sp. A-D6]|uniref:ankyrin repeat domain-containing protein n=1 Tax=Nitrincola sp. A-D6 TaxID=1545442 RepID=UPI000692161E|nr:ankyrin repeat domain-containing protein [Nitrincola sp. A-D6]